MTSLQDFDRLVASWLEAEGPASFPEASVDAAVRTAARTRRPPRWSSWIAGPAPWPSTRRTLARLPVALRVGLAVALIAGLLIAAAVAIVGSRPVARVVVSPPPSTALPPSRGGSLPSDLTVRWVGPNNPGSPFGDAGYVSLTFDESMAHLVPAGGTIDLASVATQIGIDTVQLHSTSDTAGCQRGSAGTYRWVLTPAKTVLTVSGTDDTCAARKAAISGSWQRVGACGGTNDCTGDLEARSYSTHNFDPRAPSDGQHRSVFGALSYTVPAGWNNDTDLPSIFLLKPIADYRSVPERAFDIWVFPRPAAVTLDAGCWAVEPGVGRTPRALSDFIRSRKGVNVASSGTVQVDGRPGIWLDVDLAPGWSTKCPGWIDQPGVQLLMDSSGDGGIWGAVGASSLWKVRLILLNIGQGDTVLVQLVTDDPSRFQELVTRAMPIVESFHFR